MRLAALLSVLLLAQAALTVSASGTSGGTSGPGWAMLTFSHDGFSTFTGRMHQTWGGAVAQVVLLDDSGVFMGSTGIRRGNSNLIAAIDTPYAPPLVDVEIVTSTSADGTAQIDIVGGPAFDGVILIWSAGAVGRTSWDASAASVSLRASGTRTFYSDGEGFQSETHLTLRTGSTGATIQREGIMHLDIQQNFFGRVGADGTTPGQNITLETAAGERQCPCRVRSFTDATAVGPGTMTIRREATSVHAGTFLGAVVAGADVPWPPP